MGSNRWLITLIVASAAVALAIGGLQLFSSNEAQRFNQVRAMGSSPADLEMRLHIAYTRGRVAAEDYVMGDRNGVSLASYAVTDRTGTTARFHEDLTGFDVSFLFDKLVQDGIWDLTDRPARGNTSITYTVTVNQTAQEQQGGHTFSFTDPHYWATTAGRQYTIHLDKNKPVPDLLRLSSTTFAEPRYERLVADFRAFGSVKFKATIRQARAKLGLPG
jgi:hypothetical protein